MSKIRRDKRWKQGLYTPRYPEKYLGNVNEIFYRSSWELNAFKMLDGNPNVIGWASEEIAIPYAKPMVKGNHLYYINSIYYPDLYVEYNDAEGNFVRELIEIKPHKQTKPSRARNYSKKLNENYTFQVNKHKWEAAVAWCEKRNIKFSVATEKSIFK
jgi:hypothetical protein